MSSPDFNISRLIMFSIFPPKGMFQFFKKKVKTGLSKRF